MPKDRLAEFKERSGSKDNDVKAEADDSEEVRLFVGSENDVIGQLQTEVDAIKRDINIIERSLKLLKQKQDHALLVGVSEEKNKLELAEITDNINKIARCLRRKLKTMCAQVEHDDKNPFGNSEENRIRKIQYMTVKRKFTEVIQTYLELQEVYRDKFKRLIIRQYLIVYPNKTDEDIEKMLEDDNEAVFTENLLVEQISAKQALDDANALNIHLKKIEQGILEVHDLFQELGQLVNQQGEILDRIETYVGSVKESTGKGVKQLADAKAKKRKYNRCRCFCISGIVFVVVIVVTAVVISIYTA